MANQAAKKAVSRTHNFRTEHGWAVIAVMVFYMIMRFGLFYSGWVRFHTYVFSAAVVVTWICYSTILGHLESGGKIDDKVPMVETSRDTLYLLMFTQTVSVFSDNAWWLMVLVPIFLGYKFLTGVILPWIFNPSEPEPEIELSKTQQKKQKRAEKFGR